MIKKKMDYYNIIWNIKCKIILIHMDYSLYYFLFSRKKVHLIINKKSYFDIINKYIKIILKETKDFESIKKRNDLMKYYIEELQKNKMIDLTKNEIKI